MWPPLWYGGGLAVEHTDAHRRIQLVAGECVEVAADALHVHRRVGDGLGAVEQYRHTGRVSPLDDAPHRRHRTERVGNVRHRHQAGARTEPFLEFIERERAVVVDRHDAQRGAGLLAGDLPGHDVGVVLHRRDDNLVAGAQKGAAEGGGDEVDGFGGATHEDDLVGPRGIDEAAHPLACRLVEVGGAVAEEMHAAVGVGVVLQVVAAHGLDNLDRLLRRRGTVEVGEPAAAHRTCEQRKVVAQPMKVSLRHAARTGRTTMTCGSRA
jgi:hypothetical protein